MKKPPNNPSPKVKAQPSAPVSPRRTFAQNLQAVRTIATGTFQLLREGPRRFREAPPEQRRACAIAIAIALLAAAGSVQLL